MIKLLHFSLLQETFASKQFVMFFVFLLFMFNMYFHGYHIYDGCHLKDHNKKNSFYKKTVFLCFIYVIMILTFINLYYLFLIIIVTILTISYPFIANWRTQL